MDEVTARFRRLLRYLRDDRKISQEVIGPRLGCTGAHIGRLIDPQKDHQPRMSLLDGAIAHWVVPAYFTDEGPVAPEDYLHAVAAELPPKSPPYRAWRAFLATDHGLDHDAIATLASVEFHGRVPTLEAYRALAGVVSLLEKRETTAVPNATG